MTVSVPFFELCLSLPVQKAFAEILIGGLKTERPRFDLRQRLKVLWLQNAIAMSVSVSRSVRLDAVLISSLATLIVHVGLVRRQSRPRVCRL